MNLHDPTTRWGVGLASGALIAAIAVLFLDGTTRLLVLALAVFDAVSTPQFLKHAAAESADR
ncbi:hypothetical protein NP511_14865 [Natrinema thermotolerans]|uniref:Uncharacterized protein n=1 Tax=Natrinema thermotolerans TaxID=121872 RepID=A0AAF0T0Y5_9EURY|nr:hypothetical protein [Natrinema thermotolerans]ELZ12074.1 hypothetical protein C478_10748 [Natrinema thermotolerans DSM 11552]QCC59680.1 hypothetical protein DVR14_14010 [Natrinema thermotolerans]WMT06662.1 hypothetical protein NP511_14865 [Natrinema thermotolerans]